MKTLLRLSFALAVVPFLIPNAAADEKSRRKAAEDLLLGMKMDKQLQHATDQMLDLQVKTNPQLAQYRGAMKKFFDKYMSWDTLKDEMIGIYAEAFTEEELNEISAFYKTPAGKKVIEKMPELMTKGMQLGARRVQMNQAELQRMIEEERNKKP